MIDKLLWDEKNNFIENACFTFNYDFVSVIISNNNMNHWNE